MRRSRNVMLRLSEEEHELLHAAVPPDHDKAAFVRRLVMSGLAAPRPNDHLRRVAAFIVACLSQEFTFEEALSLLDEHVPAGAEGVHHGGGR